MKKNKFGKNLKDNLEDFGELDPVKKADVQYTNDKQDGLVCPSCGHYTNFERAETKLNELRTAVVKHLNSCNGPGIVDLASVLDEPPQTGKESKTMMDVSNDKNFVVVDFTYKDVINYTKQQLIDELSGYNTINDFLEDNFVFTIQEDKIVQLTEDDFVVKVDLKIC